MSEAEVPSAEELVEEFRKAKVDEFLVHTCSLLASLAYGKLDAKELDQARLAIDALRALQPLVVALVGDGVSTVDNRIQCVTHVFFRR